MDILKGEELNKKLAIWRGFESALLDDDSGCVLPINGWKYPDLTYKDRLPNFIYSTDVCLEWLVPKTGFDALWIIHNPGKIRYCWGYVRGKESDEICWSKTLPTEECLSPIEDEPALAFCKAAEMAIDAARKKIIE